MPDLNDDLFSSFKDEGAPVQPLPASEVRRRGDRMRRRTNTLATVGGVAAALVAIATPLAIVTNQSDSSTDRDRDVAHQSPEVAWKQQVPSDLELRTGLPDDDPDNPAQSTSTPEVATIDVCGETAFDADDAVAVSGAHWEPADPSGLTLDRTLALYADDTAARDVFATITDVVDSCPAEDPTAAGDTVRWQVTPSDLPADEAVVVTRGQYSAGDDDFALTTDYYVVARTGNALLVTLSAGVANDPDPSVDEVRAEQDDVREVVDEMAVFSEESSTVSDPAAMIAGDFPIDAGMATEGARPASVGEAVGEQVISAVTLCDGDAWAHDVGPVDVLGAAWSDGETGGEQRTLATYGSVDDAQAALDAIRDGVAGCLGAATDSDFGYATLDSSVGDDSAAFAETRAGTAPATVWLVVRDGRALVLDHVFHEDSSDLTGAQQAADSIAERLGDVLDTLDIA